MSEEQQTQTPVNIPGINDDSMIKLGDNEYRFGDLSDQAKQIVAALRNSEQQILNTRNQLGLMDVGRRALAAQLRVAIENPEAQQQNDQG
jgi:hypothetical protein|tara:strand:+ start:2093 stop:2362 length:270 start_codon:yes stop_codon:yes gene_type:complete